MWKWDLEVLYHVFTKFQTELLNDDEQIIHDAFIEKFQAEANPNVQMLIHLFGVEAIALEEIQNQYQKKYNT